MPTILTFGDSNTHGTPPMPNENVNLRLTAGERWPHVMARGLGPDWALIEEGLPGRTTAFDDLVTGAVMNGVLGLQMALRTHGPIDWLTIMLGTNDTQTQYGVGADAIASGLAQLLLTANSVELQDRHGGFKTLVICPPPVIEEGTFARQFFGGAAKSRALLPLYRDLADKWGASFMDAGELIEASTMDGVHFGAEAHAVLGAAVAAKLAAA